MPAAQREVTNREIRFTVRFDTTITIAARPVSPSSVVRRFSAQGASTPDTDRTRPRTGRRATAAAIRKLTARRIPNSRAMTRLAQGRSETADVCERSMMKGGRLWRRTPDASAIGALRGNDGIPEGRMRSRRERGRRRTRQDQISGRALTPGVKLRVVKDTRTERRKACFFCRTGFARASLF
jgi:hypothetical protein